ELDVVVDRAKVDSFYTADGSGVHRVACDLENVRSKTLEWKLPHGMQLESVQLNSQPLPSSAIVPDGTGLQILLPNRFERGLLTMELRSSGPLLSRQPEIAPPLLTGGALILSGEWNVSLPSGFVAVGSCIEPDKDWPGLNERLFGPLLWL